MKFLKIIFLVVCLFIYFSCKEWAFTDEDILRSINEQEQKSKIHSPTNKKTQPESYKQDQEFLNEELSNEHEIIQENITIISEDLELKKHLIINSQKVVLDMAKLKTNEYNLAIIADEFLSKHSIIQNFPEGQKAKKRKEGKNGGNVSILTNKARGNLKLVLNGESGGFVSKRRVLTKEERQELLGFNGTNGRDAIYKKFCEIESFLFLTNRRCRFECVLKPTRGEDGGEGKRGLKGEAGRNGGDTGSFHLQAYDLSGFYLTEVKKTAGLGSAGGKGSFGGFGGKAGLNGKDDKNLCGAKLSRPKRGDKGKRGLKGEDGKNGVERLACLEVLDTPFKTNEQILDVINKTAYKKAYKKAFLNKSSFNLEEIKNQEGVICH